jgi:hypothetical protein
MDYRNTVVDERGRGAVFKFTKKVFMLDISHSCDCVHFPTEIAGTTY